MPFRPIAVVVHPSAQGKLDDLERLVSEGRQPAQAIWKGLRTATARIKSDGQWGEVLPPSAIPRSYVDRFGVSNLYCVDLPAFHRLFYTIRDRYVVIIDLVDDREHDRLMER